MPRKYYHYTEQGCQSPRPIPNQYYGYNPYSLPELISNRPQIHVEYSLVRGYNLGGNAMVNHYDRYPLDHTYQHRRNALKPPLLRSPNASQFHADNLDNIINNVPHHSDRYRRYNKAMNTTAITFPNETLHAPAPNQWNQPSRSLNYGNSTLLQDQTHFGSLSNSSTSFDTDSLRTQTSISSAASFYSGISVIEDDNRDMKQCRVKTMLMSNQKADYDTSESTEEISTVESKSRTFAVRRKQVLCHQEIEGIETEANRAAIVKPEEQQQQQRNNSIIDPSKFYRAQYTTPYLELDELDPNAAFTLAPQCEGFTGDLFSRPCGPERNEKCIDSIHSKAEDESHTEKQVSDNNILETLSNAIFRQPQTRFIVDKFKNIETKKIKKTIKSVLSEFDSATVIHRTTSLVSKLRERFGLNSKSDTDDNESITSTSTASLLTLQKSKVIIELENLFRKKQNTDSSEPHTLSKNSGIVDEFEPLEPIAALTRLTLETNTHKEESSVSLQYPVRSNMVPKDIGSKVAYCKEMSPNESSYKTRVNEELCFKEEDLTPQNLTVGDIYPGALKSTRVRATMGKIERSVSLRRQLSINSRIVEENIPNAQEIEVISPIKVNSVLSSAMKRGKSCQFGGRKMNRASETQHVSFASQIQVYRTYSSQVYDRCPIESLYDTLGEPGVLQSTCEELNQWKMLMDIHPDSVQNTHWHRI